MSTRDAVIEQLQGGNVDGALAAFAASKGAERDGALDVLTEVLDELEVNVWDQLRHRLAIAEAVIAAAPERDEPHLVAFDARCKLGRFDDAIAGARAHLDRAGMLPALFRLACLRQQRAMIEELLVLLSQRADPELAEPLRPSAEKLLGKTAAGAAVALDLYRGVLACAPDPALFSEAALAALVSGRLLMSVELLRRGLALDPDHKGCLQVLLLAIAAGKAAAMLVDVRPRALAHLAAEPDDDLLGALVSAELAVGRAAEAVAILEQHAPESSLTPERWQLRCLYARALARAGRVDEAAAMFRTGISESDAKEHQVHRARAAIAYARGDHDAAQGSMAAAIFLRASATPGLGDLKTEPAWSLVAGAYDATAKTPIKPRRVPAEARWDPEDKEWVVGGFDDEGRKHGPYRFFRPDGTLCNESINVHGTAHGPWKRFHENGELSGDGELVDGQVHGTRTWYACSETTSELMHMHGVALSIAKSQMDYVNGTVVAIRHYDADGRHVQADGEPLPDRPAGIPADADWVADDERWVKGETSLERSSHNEGAKRVGTWRWWRDDGSLAKELTYEAGDLHGPARELSSTGEVLMEATYDHGAVVGSAVHFRRGDEKSEDFPTARERVVRAEKLGGTELWRYYDADGVETTIDGTPLGELPKLHPELGSFFEDLAAIDWSELEDRSGNAHFVGAVLRDLVAKDPEDNESISDAVHRDLSWHLYHRGNVWSATAAAIPFLVRLVAYPKTPFRVAIQRFLRSITRFSAEDVAGLGEDSDPDWVAVHAAYVAALPAFAAQLGDADPDVRAFAAALLSNQHTRVDEAVAALSGRLAEEDDANVKVAIAFSLMLIGDEDAQAAVEAMVAAPGLEGIGAAMALVMGRGDQVDDAVRDRLRRGFAEALPVEAAWRKNPFSDEPLIVEMGRALNATGLSFDEGVRIAEGFDAIADEAQLGLVAGALWMAMPGDEDDSDEDYKEVLRRLAACDAAWTFEAPLSAVLDRFDLPTERDALRAHLDAN